jgi:hypothetical protein
MGADGSGVTAYTIIPDPTHAGAWFASERSGRNRWPYWTIGNVDLDGTGTVLLARRGFVVPADTAALSVHFGGDATAQTLDAPVPEDPPEEGSGYLWEDTAESLPGTSLSAVYDAGTDTYTVTPDAGMVAALAVGAADPHECLRAPTRAEAPVVYRDYTPGDGDYQWSPSTQTWIRGINTAVPVVYAYPYGGITAFNLPLIAAGDASATWQSPQVPALVSPAAVAFTEDVACDWTWDAEDELWSGGTIAGSGYYPTPIDPQFAPLYHITHTPGTGLPTGAWTPVPECRTVRGSLVAQPAVDAALGLFTSWGWLVYPNGWRRASVYAEPNGLTEPPDGRLLYRLAYRTAPKLRFGAEPVMYGSSTVNSTSGVVPSLDGTWGFSRDDVDWSDAWDCLESGVDVGDWHILASGVCDFSTWGDITLSGPAAGDVIIIVGAGGTSSAEFGDWVLPGEHVVNLIAYPEPTAAPCILPVYLGGALAGA